MVKSYDQIRQENQSASKKRKIRRALMVATLGVVLALVAFVSAQDAITTLDTKVNKSGDNMSGSLIINATNGNIPLIVRLNSTSSVGIGSFIQDGGQSFLNFISYANTVNDFPQNRAYIYFKTARGNESNPYPVNISDDLMELIGGGYTGNGFSASAEIRVKASENYTLTSRGAYMDFYTTKNGSSSRTHQLRLTDNGNLSFISSGKGFLLKSADGTQCGFVYWGNDDTLHSNPVDC